MRSDTARPSPDHAERTNRPPEVVVGTVVYRQGTYVLDKFLANQKAIQRNSPSSELVLATNEDDLADELTRLIQSGGLRGRVIRYETVKPEHSRHPVWNVACGREALRQYMVSRTDARYLLSLDADMVYDPAIIEVLKEEIPGYDIVFSGCPLRDYGTGLAGSGCMMIRRHVLEKVEFRCVEFSNGDVLFEDNLLEMDLHRLGGKAKRGFFVHVSHYRSESEATHTAPHSVTMLRRFANSGLARYTLMRASFVVKRNIPWRMKILLHRLHRSAPSTR